MKDYLTVQQAAKYLKKHPGTIRRWIRDKKLKAEKLGGKYGIYVIGRSDLLEYMMGKVMEEPRK